MFGRHLMVAWVTAVLTAGLVACSGGSGGADGGTGYVVGADDSGGAATRRTAPEPDTVSGRRDTVRHWPVKTARATRPHLVRKCTTGTRRVRHTSGTGTGTRRRTRTWYTTERYRSCRKVRSGTESYRRVVRAEKWCVRLDDVDGDKARDDVWYRVTRAVYGDALDTDRHARMKFTPAGTGC
ncbi:hypothetical protein AQJ66_25190 [Streptomyces bungoensis]|uniref:Lipoprotein n=1 Tax=Streptomyces bungoensis TaxID=285568 RepID=A0A117RB29_9ACTN|nr:hypothetical protein [Streptomyces bungoensis]KUN80971.1 hypothetical protein AQJ66_25190 [Streptomyces bungoensis]